MSDSPSHDVLRDERIAFINRVFNTTSFQYNDHQALEDLEDLIDAHTEEKVREARLDEMENVKLVTYRDEMVRYADKRIKALTNKGKGDK